MPSASFLLVHSVCSLTTLGSSLSSDCLFVFCCCVDCRHQTPSSWSWLFLSLLPPLRSSCPATQFIYFFKIPLLLSMGDQTSANNSRHVLLRDKKNVRIHRSIHRAKTRKIKGRLLYATCVQYNDHATTQAEKEGRIQNTTSEKKDRCLCCCFSCLYAWPGPCPSVDFLLFFFLSFLLSSCRTFVLLDAYLEWLLCVCVFLLIWSLLSRW